MMAGAAGGGGSNSGFKILETNDATTSNDNAKDLGITTSQDLSHDLAKLVRIGVVIHSYSIPIYYFSRIYQLFLRNLIFY